MDTSSPYLNQDAFAFAKPACISMAGTGGTVSICPGDKPPSIKITPGMEWDDVAKTIWNRMAQLVGQAPIFPETK